MLPTNKRRGGPLTFGQALGAKDETSDLILNSFETATCQHCGSEPKLMTALSRKGRTIVLWMTLPHPCKGPQ